MKKKNDKNLVWIDKPVIDDEGNSNALNIGIKTWQMYNSDYNLTIMEIGSILECERKWVNNYVKDNVKHIFLNEKFRSYLNIIDKQNKLNSFSEGNYLKDYYYFSRKDFIRWLNENTKITRQTIQVNIEDYSEDPNKIKKLKQVYDKNYKKLVQIGAKIGEFEILKSQYEVKFYSLLNAGGKEILNNEINVTKRKAIIIDVTKTEGLPCKFTTIKNLKEDRSLELAYRRLYKHGALKYTIVDSLVRYDVDYIEKGHIGRNENILTIPYDVYLQNKKYLNINN